MEKYNKILRQIGRPALYRSSRVITRLWSAHMEGQIYLHKTWPHSIGLRDRFAFPQHPTKLECPTVPALNVTEQFHSPDKRWRESARFHPTPTLRLGSGQTK